jgi:tRNA threonylcarbamoyladenosine biosynthesis protein TsaE
MNLVSHSVNSTVKIGKVIAHYLNKGDILCLFGQLGSGKTVLTRGIGLGLGVEKNQVISPSFVLIRQYQGRIPVYHFDLYRLDEPGDILGLGYEEFFYDQGVCVIEWADRLKSLLPQECLKIELSVKGKTERGFEFTARGSRYKKLLEKIRAHLSR